MTFIASSRRVFRDDGRRVYELRQATKGSNPVHKVPHGCWAAVKGLVRIGFNVVRHDDASITSFWGMPLYDWIHNVTLNSTR